MQLAFEQYGTQGPPLIILHGLLGSSDNWRTLGKQFGEQFRVFAVDLRNHGSSPHSDTINYSVMADDLLEFIRWHELSPAHILGHSLGGKVAMQFALSHPSEVRKLIVADMAPREHPPTHRKLLDTLAALDLNAIHSRHEASEALADEIPKRSTRQFLLKNLKRVDEGKYQWQMNLEAIRSNYDDLTAGIEPIGSPFTKPALFIRGSRSDYVTDEDEQRIQQLFPQAEIVTLPDAGHWVHAEAPEAFAEKVVEFLR